MDFLRKTLWQLALRAPDDAIAAEPVAETQPPAPPAELAAEPEPVVEPEPPAPAPAADHGNKGKQPWFLARIASENEARRAAEQRAADAEAMLQRMQAGNQPDGTPVPARQPPATEFDAAVRAEAARLRLGEDSTAIRDAGLQEFGPAFRSDLDVLNAVGAVGNEMVLDLVAVDKSNAHKILSNLAKDPEKAASLAGMDSRRRIAELTRMADALKTAPAADAPAPKVVPAKQVSRAPAPPPAVDPSASKTVDGYSDDASDAEFTRQFNERMKARANRR